MSKGQGKVNTGAGLSAEDIARLTEELSPVAAPTNGAADEFAAMKAQISKLIAENDKLAKDLSGYETTEVVEAATATISNSATKERFAITIEEGHENHDAPDVFVGVNGRSYLIQRGMRVEVPKEVLEVLDHAVIDKHIPVKDQQGMPNGTETRASRRFPYQNHGKVIDLNGDRIGA